MTMPEALDYAHFVPMESWESALTTALTTTTTALHTTAKSPYPKSYAEAMTRPDAQHYHEAACKEIDALLENGTWELARLPPGRKAIGCRWVFC